MASPTALVLVDPMLDGINPYHSTARALLKEELTPRIRGPFHEPGISRRPLQSARLTKYSQKIRGIGAKSSYNIKQTGAESQSLRRRDPQFSSLTNNI
jgi:hypothetical protein